MPLRSCTASSSSLRHRLRALAPCTLALLLVACGDKGATTQAIAKVNDGELTVHQLNFLLQRTAQTPDDAKRITPDVVEQLIDEELLNQAAAKSKLDRDPRVLRAIDAARREIIARAYIEQTTGGASRPGTQEIRDYHAAHPALFAERRVYVFREIALDASEALEAQVRAQLGRVPDMERLLGWLKSQKVRYSARSVTRAADQVGTDEATQLQGRAEGHLLFTRNGGTLVVQQIARIRSEPLDLERARPAIEALLTRQRNQQVVRAEIKRLRDVAKIEYRGEFAKTADSKPAERPAASGPKS